MKTAQVMDGVTSLSLSPYLSLGLCIFVLYPHTHTKQQANELFFASMFCLHYWTVQRQTQKPPLKGRDSLDKLRHCIPGSLVPQRCRISTHTSGLVVRLGLVASCGSGWLTVACWLDYWLVGRIDNCRFLTGWQTASSASLWVHM